MKNKNKIKEKLTLEELKNIFQIMKKYEKKQFVITLSRMWPFIKIERIYFLSTPINI